MRFDLSINMEGDAFANSGSELSRILHEVALRVMWVKAGGIQDINGNTVGSFGPLDPPGEVIMTIKPKQGADLDPILDSIKVGIEDLMGNTFVEPFEGIESWSLNTRRP